MRETRLDLHICPSDLSTELPDQPESGPGSGDLWARGSYRGNAGRSDGHPRWWDSQQSINAMPRGWRGPLTTTCGPASLWEKPGGSAGFCTSEGLTADIRMRHIADGTSKTLFIGEQTTIDNGDSARRRRTFWAYGYTSYNKSEVMPESRTMFSNYERCVALGGGESNACKRAWGTAHVNGAIMFAYVDGSVHSIDAAVDMEVFASHASINGQEVAPAL